MVDPPEIIADYQPRGPSNPGALPFLIPAIIVSVAACLRLWTLDSTSLWYDEIVTMRVARADGPGALVERLDQIDGTRAPLHPLILQVWLRVFGPSDLAGRSFSAFCGLGTVAVIFLLGRLAFDEITGRWAAWLAAVCPPLVYYSQEARMYAWLVLVTCVVVAGLLLVPNNSEASCVRALLAALDFSGLQSSSRFFHGGGARPFLFAGPALSQTDTAVVADDPCRRALVDHAMAWPIHGPWNGLPDVAPFDTILAGRPH